MSIILGAAAVRLDSLTAADESRAGGKAYNCGRLRRAGFRVPDGVVVLADTDDAAAASVADDLWFDLWSPGARYAVRSSGIGEDGAGESFAGIHETFLNVERAGLAGAVAACRASARSAQAIAYRTAKGRSTDTIETAVLIQRMVQPETAGVAFTVNPVTGREDEIVINASWGLGEALVSGQIDPDEFVIGKKDRRLRWSRVGEKGAAGATGPSLTVQQIEELAGTLIEIEQHYGAPQDVEWCHDGTAFWILQSRPVTAARAAASEPEWTRANLAEVFHDMTSHQALSTFAALLDRAEREYMGKLFAPEEELGPIVRNFYGRMHFNLSQLRRACVLGGTPPAVMLRAMGHSEAIQPEDERTPPFSREQLRIVPDVLRIVLQHLRIDRQMRLHEQRTADFLRLLGEEPGPLSAAELWQRIEEWLRQAPAYMRTVLVLGNVMFHEGPVRKLCQQAGFPFERLVYPQLAAGERSVSAQQAFDLVSLAAAARREPAAAEYLSRGDADAAGLRRLLAGTAFLAQFESFLQKYGHRGPYEYDWSLPRYAEDPSPLLQALRAHLEDERASAAGSRSDEDANAAWQAFERCLTPWQRWTRLPLVRRSLRRIKQYYLWRERVRSDIARVLTALRAWHVVLAARLVERGWLADADDYFLLELGEVGAVVAGRCSRDECRAIVAGRAKERERIRGLQMPLFMRESELPALLRAGSVTADTAGSDLTGQAVSAGCVEAEVVVVQDPRDFARMKRGAILVAPATDPSWTPLFTLASGVIVEIGGVLSHASTIAREYGLPALANVKHATRRLRTGERVRLDATRGVISRLPAAAPAEA